MTYKWQLACNALHSGFQGDCRIGSGSLCFNPLMKQLSMLAPLASAVVLFLIGCGSPGPSPEQQVREADQQREAERQQAEFRKGLPPVANPGRSE